MPISVHIHNQEAMEYDAILFCRKRMEEKSVAWDELESMIRTQAAEVLAQVSQQNGTLSRMDTAVIVFGKCLEFYSQYYPYVTQDGRQIGILEALKRMTRLVDTLATTQPVTGASQAEFTQLRLLEERDFASENIYRLGLAQVIPTTVRRLETSFIAGLVMGKMPTREEFAQVVASKIAARLSTSQDGGQ